MDPVFVVGCSRSGTTLLRLILNRHSGIAIPQETWYFPQLYYELPRLIRTGNWRRAVATRVLELNSKHFPELSIEILEGILWETNEDNFADIVAVVNREFMLRQNKRRWGDKTPGYVRHLAMIKELFPNAKVIHIVRDGRDVVPSLLRYWSVGPQTDSFVETALYWRDHVLAGLNEGPLAFGDRYFEITYEDLVQNPEPTVRSICRFIDEEFEPQMLVSSAADNVPLKEWHTETRKEINGSNVSKWNKTLDNYELSVVELVGRRIFRRFKYQRVSRLSADAVLDLAMHQGKRSLRNLVLFVKVKTYKAFLRAGLLPTHSRK